MWIIMKYAEFQNPEHITADDAYSGYSCEQTGVPAGKCYTSLTEAQKDCNTLQDFNPGVSFGLVKLPE